MIFLTGCTCRWQLPMQLVTKFFSKWWRFHFSLAIPVSKWCDFCLNAVILLMTRPGALFTMRRHLTSKSHEFTELQDWVLRLLYYSDIWQVPQQCWCWGSCQISEQSKHSKPVWRGFEIFSGLMLTHKQLEMHECILTTVAMSWTDSI